MHNGPGFVTRSQAKINTSLVDACVAIISDGIVLLKSVGFDVDVSGVAVDDSVKEHIPEEWRTCWSKASGRKAELKGIVEQIQEVLALPNEVLTGLDRLAIRSRAKCPPDVLPALQLAGQMLDALGFVDTQMLSMTYPAKLCFVDKILTAEDKAEEMRKWIADASSTAAGLRKCKVAVDRAHRGKA